MTAITFDQQLMPIICSHPKYCFALLLLILLSGCRGEIDANSAVAEVNDTNLQRLGSLYFAYQAKHHWQGPEDEEQFKEFLHNYNPDKLSRMGVDPNAIDELFISERDGEPFKIRYSVAGSAMGSSEPVIFESVGVNGKRMVGFLNMERQEVDQQQYEELWQGKAASLESPGREY